MDAVAGVGMIAGIIVLIAFVVMLRWPESYPSPPKTTKSKTSDVSTNVFMSQNYVDDSPPIQHYSYTENSSEIGIYRGNNQGCTNRIASSNIKVYGDDIFVNRDQHIKNLTNFRFQHTYHLAVISGPPGFGKSRLAIQWGIKVAENGTDVRYEDLSHLANKRSLMPKHTKKESSSLTSSDHINSVQLVQNVFPGSSTYRQTLRSIRINIIEVLLKWSKDIKCPTVLILDNTEDIVFNEKSKEDLLKNVQAMVMNAHPNLHVVVTSQLQLSTTYINTREYIYSLSLNSSIELINKITTINEGDAAELATLVGGCPLALKIVASLLRLHDTEIETLKQELQAHPMKALASDDHKERLQFVFGISFNYLEQFDLHDCAYYVSLFPGSFSESVGNAILPHISNQNHSCHRTLVRYSLLERYWAHTQPRFEMHRLLREYARERGHNESFEIQRHFNEKFCNHFTTILRDHALFIKEGNHVLSVWEEHQFNHSLENLNMQFLLQILVSKNEHSLQELQVLAFAACQEDISFTQIERHYHEYINKISEVCSVLVQQACEELYKDVTLHTLRNTCKSSTFVDHARSLFIPCGGMFDCNTLQTLHKNRRIWIHLTGEGQIYLRHLEVSYCKPVPFLNFHFPWPVLFLIASAELAIIPTVLKNPPIIVKVVFMFASTLSILDIGCSCYDILWRYPDQDDVTESCIAYIAEIMIYLTCFVIFVPRIFVPYCRMYREDNLITQSHIFYSLFIVLLYVALHYAITSFPNILSYM